MDFSTLLKVKGNLLNNIVNESFKVTGFIFNKFFHNRGL